MSPEIFFTPHGNVAIYVPQLLGYARIGLALAAFALANHNPVASITLYLLSFVSDELDGRFARMLGQTSTLGAVLDMVTDRVATTGLASILYARAIQLVGSNNAVLVALILFGLVALDIFSHWFHMYAILATKGFGTSHKETSDSQPWLLRLYYSQRVFMGFCCVCVEVMYLALYTLTFAPTNAIARGVAVASLPGFLLKNLANCVQLRDASKMLIALDASVGTEKKIKRSRTRSRSAGGSRSRSRSRL